MEYLLWGGIVFWSAAHITLLIHDARRHRRHELARAASSAETLCERCRRARNRP